MRVGDPVRLKVDSPLRDRLQPFADAVGLGAAIRAPVEPLYDRLGRPPVGLRRPGAAQPDRQRARKMRRRVRALRILPPGRHRKVGHAESQHPQARVQGA